MRNLKKILSIGFILTFVVGLIPAYAAGNGVIKIKNNPSKTGTTMVGHTYNMYKVFDMTLEQGEGGASDKYSYTIAKEFENFFKEKNKDNLDLNEFAKSYITEENKNTVAKELMDYANKNNIAPVKATNKEEVVVAEDKTEMLTVSGLDLGYYLIVDKGVSGNESHVVAAASMGSTATELVIDLKAQAPTIDKDIKHNENGNFGEVGDNQIGDTVEYRFISTMPDTIGYKNYKYIIHDKMTAGLTFNNDIAIYVGDKDNGGTLLDTSNYSVNNNPTDGHTFDIDINIMKMINEKLVSKGDKLYIYFTATLNKDAAIAGDSNDNTVNLEYSNNPYDENSKDKTPDVTVKDYTFKLNALKTREDGTTALQGAEFEIRKGKDSLYFTKEGDTYTVCAEKHDHTTVDTCTTKIVSGANGKFHIVGLDDSVTYTIVETKAPDGYNPIKPIDFIITAEYDKDGNIASISTNASGITQVDGTFELGTTIINKTDSLLPETGGIGTTIFTVVGGIMMLLAGGLLIRRRRAS
ncbi:MAG: SpaH/EbpB family LPXTG-anchored major pilin [Clostridium sp.]